MKTIFDIDQRIIDKYFNKDMRWTLIWEKIKMRVPISVDDRDYFISKTEAK